MAPKWQACAEHSLRSAKRRVVGGKPSRNSESRSCGCSAPSSACVRARAVSSAAPRHWPAGRRGRGSPPSLRLAAPAAGTCTCARHGHPTHSALGQPRVRCAGDSHAQRGEDAGRPTHACARVAAPAPETALLRCWYRCKQQQHAARAAATSARLTAGRRLRGTGSEGAVARTGWAWSSRCIRRADASRFNACEVGRPERCRTPLWLAAARALGASLTRAAQKRGCRRRLLAATAPPCGAARRTALAAAAPPGADAMIRRRVRVPPTS